MADYSKGKIYRICAPGCEQVYIGSTTREIRRRFQIHKSAFRHYTDERKYYSSFEILKHDGAKIELIEDFPCSSRRELERREGEIIKATQNVINRNLAGRTKEQYQFDMKEHISQKNREYFATHKKQANECARIRYVQNKDTINARNRARYAAKKNLNLILPVEPQNA